MNPSRGLRRTETAREVLVRKGAPIVSTFEEILERRRVSRRRFLNVAGAGAGAAAVMTLAEGCGGSGGQSSGTTTNPPPPPPTTPVTPTLTDTDVLNFALNLEYLTAEFYLRAVTGSGLSSDDAGSSAGAVTGGTQVPFDPSTAFLPLAKELANDDQGHVRYLRKMLGTAAISRPAIDFTNTFNAVAVAAGFGPTFNPFADANSFVVGAFLFEDLAVTAYHGAALSLTSKANLAAVAGILGTEAYHAGEIRSLLTQLDVPSITYANQISVWRGKLGGGAETTLSGSAVVAADTNSIGYSRTTDQVLHIMYLSASAGVKSGGFFPSGMNGTIKTAAS
jgi:hypothetical protein